ncbi:diguanylate cyclase [Kangiella sp.]|uniref:diguanylate cyclase n=1 Tax=Kangiella sp. TaxID=1920245 RepID=UPI003A8EBEFE
MVMVAQIKLRTIIIITLLSFYFLSVTSQAAEPEQQITLEELQQLPAFPDEYTVRTYYARIDWLNTQIEQDNSDVLDYHLKRELAFQHFSQYKNNQAHEVCQYNPPLDFDLRYRFICIASNNQGYEEPIQKLWGLYNDAMAAGWNDTAAHALTTMGWMQSSNGDIASAFQSYEQALTLGEDIDIFSMTDIMINTATLYIVHGDEDYMQRGLDLHKESLQKLRAQIEEQPEQASRIESNIEVVLYNLGIAYTLHFEDYERALEWFGKITTNQTGIEKAALVFSALAAVELGKEKLAQQYLNDSYRVASSERVDTEYLKCYQQLVEVKLGRSESLETCNNLNELTPLESELDIYKRISRLDDPELRYSGLVNLYTLFIEELEPQLKYSSSRAASTAELNRLQQESRLKSQLIEKEQALKISEKEKSKGQIRLAIAITLILLMAILMIAIRLNQKRKLAEQYEALSVIDVLTGLHNRRYFEQNIKRELSFVERSKNNGSQQAIGVYLIDIDHFKKVNDTYGHDVGDKVLTEFTSRIQSAIRETDMFIRWGGEEFLLVARLEQSEDHKFIANRISKAITDSPFAVGADTTINVTCTIGSTIYPYASNQDTATHWSNLVQLADLALYYSKRKQRNCWVCIEGVVVDKSLDEILNQDLKVSLKSGAVSISSSFDSGQSE